MKTPPVHSDPEQLVRNLEMEIQKARTQRTKSSGSRMAFRICGLVFIVFLLLGALIALQFCLSGIPRNGVEDSPASQMARLEK